MCIFQNDTMAKAVEVTDRDFRTSCFVAYNITLLSEVILSDSFRGHPAVVDLFQQDSPQLPQLLTHAHITNSNMGT